MIKPKNLKEALPYILAIGGALGVLAAGILMLEKVHLLQNPGVQLSCDINPIVACGSVINTDQASAFGFPNTILGLIGYSVITTVGMAMLAGATFKRWFWIGVQLGVLFGVGFVTWLQFETIFRINALCPYCMLAWAVTIPIFWYTTLHNLREKHIKTPTSLRRLVAFAQRHHGDILIAWFLILIAVILNHFWYYWQTLL